jgi:hypothetical protein
VTMRLVALICALHGSVPETLRAIVTA